MSEQDTVKTVYFTLDPDNPPTMTEEQWARFDAIRDEDIDFSDAPAVTDFSRFQSYPNIHEVRAQRLTESAAKAARAQAELFAPEPVTIEDDVLKFFKEAGDASPHRINEALREYIAAHRKVA